MGAALVSEVEVLGPEMQDSSLMNLCTRSCGMRAVGGPEARMVPAIVLYERGKVSRRMKDICMSEMGMPFS